MSGSGPIDPSANCHAFLLARNLQGIGVVSRNSGARGVTDIMRGEARVPDMDIHMGREEYRYSVRMTGERAAQNYRALSIQDRASTAPSGEEGH